MLRSFLQQNQSQGQNGTCLKLRRGGGKSGRGGQGGEMTQTMYAHNKKNVLVIKSSDFKDRLGFKYWLSFNNHMTWQSTNQCHFLI
jgi:hypothetical protein